MTGRILSGLAIFMSMVNPDQKGLFWIAAAIFHLAASIGKE